MSSSTDFVKLEIMHNPTIKLLFHMTMAMVLSCSQNNEAKPAKQLLVYCGITMIKPMAEIAGIIEKKENCEIVITKGGSGNLYNSIKINKVGDLYLPGSESYINEGVREGIVVETIHVGYNKAALMVQFGNPKNITADLDNLTKSQYRVVLGNPDSGSIGKETKKILEKKGIFEQVMRNALFLTTDSKDLVGALRERRADLVINWYATSAWPENKGIMSVLPIDEQYAPRERLVLGRLKMSAFPEIASKFLELAGSEEGHAIFAKYGLYNVE